MSTFSTTVTKAQRNARDFDSRGREISICSRQHTKRPGYNPSPYEPNVTPKVIVELVNSIIQTTLATKIKTDIATKKKAASSQVRPNTKRGQRAAAPTPKDILLPKLPVETFLESSCELTTPRGIFIAVHSLSKGKPCVGCAYDEHSKTGCPAKQKLLRERGLIK